MTDNVKKAVLVVCGIILLATPTLLHVSGVTNRPPFNKFRKQAVFPNLEIDNLLTFKPGGKTFSGKIRRYYTDISGFRELLVPLYLSIKNNLLHVSPYPGKAVFGKQNWLFLGDEYSQVIRESKGLVVFSDKELQRIQENMLLTNEYCAKRNIRFYMTIARDKSDVYGCNLPMEKANRPTKVDQVISILSKCGVNVIDLGKHFKLYNNRELYLKTDSHWNQLGLFIGYQTMMNDLKPGFPDIAAMNIGQFTVDSSEEYTGDLTKMISLNVNNKQVVFSPNFRSQAVKIKNRLPIPDKYSLDPAFYERRYFNKIRKYKALIIHDSFFKLMPNFMKENFRETVFLWSYFDYRIIDLEKPDMIIYELAGREIDNLLQAHVIP